MSNINSWVTSAPSQCAANAQRSLAKAAHSMQKAEVWVQMIATAACRKKEDAFEQASWHADSQHAELPLRGEILVRATTTIVKSFAHYWALQLLTTRSSERESGYSNPPARKKEQ